MPITERLMLPGNWSLKLKPDTPKTIRDAMAFYGHVYILDDQVDSRRFSDAGMKAAARYAGILRRRQTVWDLEGPGPIAWLGNEFGVGDIYESAVVLTAVSFTAAVTAVLPAGGAVVAGTLTATGANVTNTFPIQTLPRDALKWLMDHYGAVYRVNPDFTLDAGPASALFKVTPTAVAVRIRGSRDISFAGLSTTALEADRDVDDYASRIFYVAAGPTTAASGADATFKDGRGNTAKLTKIINNSLTPAALAATEAATQAAIWVKQPRTLLTLTTDEYDVPRDVKVGDNIYVYDQERGVVDTTNQIRYQGRIISPQIWQVLAITWPVERGMGVYYRDLNGIYTNLTPYVVPESPGAVFEVGAAVRRLV